MRARLLSFGLPSPPAPWTFACSHNSGEAKRRSGLKPLPFPSIVLNRPRPPSAKNRRRKWGFCRESPLSADERGVQIFRAGFCTFGSRDGRQRSLPSIYLYFLLLAVPESSQNRTRQPSADRPFAGTPSSEPRTFMSSQSKTEDASPLSSSLVERIVTVLEQTNNRLDQLDAESGPSLLTFEDVLDRVPWSRPTVLKMVKRREIPMEKRHGRWIISQEAWDRARRNHFDAPTGSRTYQST